MGNCLCRNTVDEEPIKVKHNDFPYITYKNYYYQYPYQQRNMYLYY